MSIKEKTNAFNKFTIDERLAFLDALSETERKKFISDIRQQAVKDFWIHERENILRGTCTRDWTPEQIENIMNISESSGVMNSKIAGKAFQIDDAGIALIDKAGNKSYYGHHMIDVSTHPEYAGDWRNIQALDYDEHYYGAHPNHDTKTPTTGYYDVELGKTIDIDISGKDFTFDNVKYPPKGNCIFKSDIEMSAIYLDYDTFNDAEKLALKNIERSMDVSGNLTDFNRGLDIANRYKSSNFESKIGIMTDTEISKKYNFWDEMTDADKNTFKAYEFFKERGVDGADIEKLGVKSDADLLDKYKFLDNNDSTLDMFRAYEYQSGKAGSNISDSKIYFDADGKVVGLSCFDTNVSEKASFSVSINDAKNYLSDVEMTRKFSGYSELNDLDKLKLRDIDYKMSNLTDTISDEAKAAYIRQYNDIINQQKLELDIKTDIDLDIDDLDKAVIILTKDDITTKSFLDEIMDEYKSLDTTGKKILKGVDVAFTLYDAYTTIKTATEQFETGDYEAATKTAYSFVATESFGFLLSEAFVPAFISVGAAFGPIGMVIGGVIGGFACYMIAGEFSDMFWSLGECIADLWEDALGARVRIDPLILDLQEDGFNIESKKYGVNFDLNCDGFAEKINWTSKDAILCLDTNGNGKVDNGREVFGDYHLLADGTRATNGFKALAQYDTNGDGIIDESDEIFGKLRLWVDSNCDGVSDSGELKTLKDMDIVAIRLDYTEANQTTNTEALIGNVATFVYADETEGQIGEMWVASDLYDTVETFIAGVSETVDGFPNVRSYGTVNSLHNAIALDETGRLKAMVEQFVAEEDTEKRVKIVEDIIWFMCDAESVEPGSRGGNVDARKLKVIESFMGQEFMGVNGSNPNSAAAPILNNAYNNLVEMYCFSMIGSKINHIINYISAEQDESGNISYDTKLFDFALSTGLATNLFSEREFKDICAYIGYLGSNIQNDFQIFYQTREYFQQYAPQYVSWIDESVYGAIRGNDGNNSLIGTTASDVIYGNGGDDTISGGNGNDLLVGGAGNDTISGGSGNDILYGDSGNDVLDGGAGDDILKDSEGDDTFVFSKGYGHDVIMDEGGHNTLRFRGLKPTDILVNGTREYDVTIRIKGTDDTLVIKDFCKDGKYSDYDLEFDGGIKMHVTDKDSPFRYIYGDSSDDVLKAVVEDSLMFGFDGDDTIQGSDGNDIIYGNQGGDTISAGTGNDIVYGGDGDDVLDSGEGNDFLYGGTGDDTYIFGRNYGTDVISDEGGISTIKIKDFTLSDLTIVQAGEEAVITAKDSGDRLIISGFGQNSDGYRIQIGEEIFSLKEQVMDDKEGLVAGTGQYDYMTGSEEDEFIFAGGEGDRILAGSGNDMIFGDSGNDAIFGEDGNDYISGGDGDDYLNGGAGSDFIDGGRGNDFMDGGAGDDVYFFHPGSGSDSIMDSEGKNTIIFGDGFTAEGIKAYRSNWNDLLITFEGYEDTLTIKNYCINEDARNFTLVFADGTVTEAAADGSPLKTIYGTDGSEYMPSIYQDGITKIGQDGNDQLVGSNGNDYLYGGKGDDRITGNGGNDVLDGGEGSDFLYGGAGDDTYIFKKGYGTDTIGDGEGINTIEIYGYSQSQVKASRTNWNDMTIEFEGSEDKLVIEGFFTSEANRNFYLTFNGGGKVHATAGNSPLRTVYGTDGSDYILAMDDKGVTLMGEAGNDNLNGGNGADRLYGGTGDDQLHGNGGSDVLDGGAGNDFLYGGAGNDTYIFNMGYGTDTIHDREGLNTIRFGNGLSADKLTAYRTNWNDLTITFEDTEDKLVIQGYFTSEENRKFNVEFASGEKYAYDDVQNPIHQVHATEYDDWMSAWSDEGVTLFGDGGNDHLTGGTGDDYLAGGTGNDYLAGGAGDDTYLFGKGDGADTIEDREGMNQIVFKGVNSDEVTFNKLENGNLEAGITGETDTLTIKGFQSDNYTFAFEDGVTGTVDTQTGVFTETISEDELTQSMAEMLAEIYVSGSMEPEAVTEAGAELLVDVPDSVSIREESDVITEQTDIQVMVLTENMAAFGTEDNISDTMDLTKPEEESVFTGQMLVDTLAQ
jgi:Ca2+-binding RTX toxin-like protein